MVVNIPRERCLILAFDRNGQVVTCFDKSKRSLVYVKIRDDFTHNAALFRHGNFLLFSRRRNHELTTSRPIFRRWTEVSVERPTEIDCIRFENEETKICSWVAFSSNPTHRTFGRKVAFSDWYGLIDCNGRKLDREMYKVYIVLNDINYVNNGTCLFRLDQVSNRNFNEHQRILLTTRLEQFEREIASKYSPISAKRSISMTNENFPTLKSSTRMATDANGAIEAIVLAVKDSTATCYSEHFESQITVCMPIGFLVSEGQMIMFENYDYVNDIYIPVPNATKTRACSNRIRFQNKVMFITAVAACSDIPRHQTYNQRLAYAGPFGIVRLIEELPSRGQAFNVELVINDLDALKNRTQLFQVGSISNQIPQEESIEFMKKLRNFENLQLCWETIPRELNYDNQQGTSSSASRSVPRSQPSFPVRCLPETVRAAPDDSPIANRIPPNYQPEQTHFPIPSAANSIIAESSLASMAVVTAQTDEYFVVYLYEKNAGAFLKNESDTPTLLVGTVFNCTYVGAHFNEIYWEVTSVLELVGGKSECRIVDGKCQLLFSIDLCNRNELFAEHWMAYGEPPIVNSELGFITMAHNLKDPEGNVMRCHDLSRKYMGRERAASMLGWCSFEQYDVPRMTLDNEYIGEETVYTFGWRLIEVCGSYDQVLRRERSLIESNLGNKAQELEMEDDVARQKRMNKEVSEFESRISSRAASTVGGDYRRPSSSRQNQQRYNRPVWHDNASSSSVFHQNIAPFSSDSPTEDPKVKQIKLLQATLARSIRINEQLFVDGEDLIRKFGQNIDTTQLESHLEQCSSLIRDYRGKKQHLMSNLNII